MKAPVRPQWMQIDDGNVSYLSRMPDAEPATASITTPFKKYVYSHSISTAKYIRHKYVELFVAPDPTKDPRPKSRMFRFKRFI